MTSEVIKDYVNDIISDSASTLQVYLILEIDKKYELRLADIEEEGLSALKKLFIRNLYDSVANSEELEVRSLSADDEMEGALYIYDYSEYPEELGLIKQFTISDGVKIGKFNFEKDNLNKLFGFIIYIGTMDKGFILFKKHYSVALIKRDSFLLGAVKSKKRFEKVSGDDILRINSDWQLINIDGELLVRDISVLEKNLGFTEFIEKEANSAIHSIGELNIVNDMGTLLAEKDNLAFMRKLAKIQKSSVVFSKKVSGDKLIEFINKTPGLKEQFHFDASKKKIKLSTKAEKGAFLRLLNDDFLQSQLTEEYYAANSKDRLNYKG